MWLQRIINIGELDFVFAQASLVFPLLFEERKIRFKRDVRKIVKKLAIHIMHFASRSIQDGLAYKLFANALIIGEKISIPNQNSIDIPILTSIRVDQNRDFHYYSPPLDRLRLGDRNTVVLAVLIEVEVIDSIFFSTIIRVIRHGRDFSVHIELAGPGVEGMAHELETQPEFLFEEPSGLCAIRVELVKEFLSGKLNGAEVGVTGLAGAGDSLDR
jgi:hypothetical protein